MVITIAITANAATPAAGPGEVRTTCAGLLIGVPDEA
jgi:hypothetical protein